MEASKNCLRISEKYWLENITELFTHYTLLPNDKMSLGAKMNSLLRLSVLFFIILTLLDNDYSWFFLCGAVIINIAFYYKYRNEY